ncbi:MAG TPA: HEAT repeat domain-containing protein, partial [Pirellulales bacterium]|nr:HEAT repeat domain-containing protein [Pirellulales bacterium]
MYDEDSFAAQWFRWLVRSLLAAGAVAAIGGWYYLNRPQQGPWSKTVQQNLAIVRDHSRRESERRLANDALEHAGASIVPDLTEELTQGDALGRELAALALGRLRSKASAAVEPLTLALTDRESAVRERAAVALGQVCPHPQTVVASLQRILHDADSHVRDKAFEILRGQEAAGAEALAELLDDADADVRRRAVIELDRMGPEADGARKTVLAAINDAHPQVRIEALKSLFHHRALGLEEVHDAIDDADATVRTTALALLRQMGPAATPIVPELITKLQKAFDDGDIEAAGPLAATLGSIGPTARSATDVLLEHIVDAPHSLDVQLRVALQGVGLEAEYELPLLLERAEAAGDDVKSLILWGLPRTYALHPQEPTSPQYEITDADLAHLSGLVNLELLNLNQTAIGDAGLAHLAGLVRLKSLQLWCTKVTSAGLVHLVNMTRLRSLSLADCAVTDDGLRHLRRLDQLERLSLSGTQI